MSAADKSIPISSKPRNETIYAQNTACPGVPWVTDPIIDQEIAFAHLILSGTMNDRPRRLMHAFAERAKDMVAMDPGKERTEQFRDETAKILKAWAADRINMDNYWKKFFSLGLMEPGGKILEKVIGKAAEATPAAASAATGALAGLALHAPLLASGAGLGIGLFTHAAKAYVDLRSRDRESPYRYLTLLEGTGVVIRADLRGAPDAS